MDISSTISGCEREMVSRFVEYKELENVEILRSELKDRVYLRMNGFAKAVDIIRFWTAERNI